jgi:two-component system OmpR family sensor kinase
MNKQSIFFTILVSFLISIVLVIISFLVLITHDYRMKEGRLLDKYHPVVRLINKQDFISGEHSLRNFEEMNYKIIFDRNEIQNVLNNSKTKLLVEKIHPIKNDEIFRILNLDGDNYLYLSKKGNFLLIKDENTPNESNSQIYISLVFAILLVMIILIYLVTLKKLRPLKLLKDSVKTLGDEKFDFEFDNLKGKDEVSLLALEFKKTASKLKSLKEARNIFIRNIMHELKTPITKGKLLTQLELNEQNNEKLKSVFNRLESLINEFATIEELISSSKTIEKKSYFLDDIVDNAKDILMVDEDDVLLEYENQKLDVNFKLFSIAVKNLIDNGIKYSFDKKVTIKSSNQEIIFENIGKKLEFPLENYFEPFFSNEDKSKDSFGLGLYIVHNILKANGYTLQYEFKDEINRFICKKD